jgi:predicted metal-dependent hydrolase
MTIEDDLAEGLARVRAGSYFEAHEHFEAAWRAAASGERDFFQGLVHVSVAWYQAGRGRPVGCSRQLAKAERRLTPYAPRHRGVDVAGVLAAVRVASALVDAGTLELAPPLDAESDRP